MHSGTEGFIGPLRRKEVFRFSVCLEVAEDIIKNLEIALEYIH